jgi:hypothetical protein
MPRTFDAPLKNPIEGRPTDWVHFLGVSEPGAIEVADTHTSTVSAASGKVLRLSLPSPRILHFELYLIGCRLRHS